MRFARFLFFAGLMPVVIAAQDTKQLALTGQRAFFSGEYTTAVYFLKQAVAAEPQHAGAWRDLCQAYLALDQLDSALDACRRHIAVNPQSPDAYVYLASVLWQKDLRDDAIAAVNRQIEIKPQSGAAHAALGRYYYLTGNYRAAIAELETAAAAIPPGPFYRVELGGAYLAIGQTDKGLAILKQLVEDNHKAAMLNPVAYALASCKVALDHALEYIQSAMNATISLGFGRERIDIAELRNEVLLTECWGTMGWVQFQRGDLDEAEKYLSASWALNPRGEVGDHLGQLYERRGKRQPAIDAYARALASPHALHETRQRLETLVPPAEMDSRIAHARDELVAMRTISAGKLMPDQATATFFVVQAAEAAIAQFTRGDERFRSLTKSVGQRMPPANLPDSSRTMLGRVVNLTCPGNDGDCTMELLPASAAVFAELKAEPVDVHFDSSARQVGGHVISPVPVFKPEPEYSEEARKKHIEGTVVVYVVVDPTGHARDIKVLRSLGYGLDEEAIACVRRWEFKPGMKDGQPVSVAATIEVNFGFAKRR